MVGAICAVTLGLPFIVGTAPDSGITELQEIRDTVAANPTVRTTRVGFHKVSYLTLKSGSGRSEYFGVVVKLRAAPTEAIARQLEEAIFAAHAEKIGETPLVIVLERGFTFGGLASASTSFNLSTSLSKWRTRTQGADT